MSLPCRDLESVDAIISKISRRMLGEEWALSTSRQLPGNPRRYRQSLGSAGVSNAVAHPRSAAFTVLVGAPTGSPAQPVGRAASVPCPLRSRSRHLGRRAHGWRKSRAQRVRPVPRSGPRPGACRPGRPRVPPADPRLPAASARTAAAPQSARNAQAIRSQIGDLTSWPNTAAAPKTAAPAATTVRAEAMLRARLHQSRTRQQQVGRDWRRPGHHRSPRNRIPTDATRITDVMRSTCTVSTSGAFALDSAESTPICAIPPGAVDRNAV
jgi:hypothetical protein